MIHLFNPTCEIATATGNPYYEPPAVLKTFEKDLSTLPIVYAETNDSIYVDSLPCKEFIDYLNALPFNAVQFIQADAIDWNNYINPWGWAPNVKGALSAEHIKNARLYLSRINSVFLFNALYDSLNDTSKEVLTKPIIHNSYTDIEQKINAKETFVLKSLFSSSGRGVLFFDNQVDVGRIQKAKSILKKQGQIIEEEWYNRVQDFSIQFYKKGNTIEYLGITKLLVSNRGEYQGNMLFETIDHDYLNVLLENGAEIYRNAILSLDVIKDYEGPIGVDAFLFVKNGSVWLNPCVEMNCRHTMGYVSKSFEKYVDSSSKATFQVRRVTQEQRSNYLQIPEMVNGKISQGNVNVTPINKDTQFCAVLNVEQKS